MVTVREPGSTTATTPGHTPGPDVLAAGLVGGAVHGVLFDIDDTLVDLEFAMTACTP